MEFGVINSNKGPIKVSHELRDMLVDFTVEVILEEPEELYSFASQYFNEIMKKLSETPEIIDTYELKPLIEKDFRSRAKVSIMNFYYKEQEGEGEDVVVHIEDTQYKKSDTEWADLEEAVSKCYIFKSFSEDLLDTIMKILFPIEVVAGETIIRDSDRDSNFCIIESGIYQSALSSTIAGEPNLVYTHKNMGYFGDLSIAYKKERTVNVQAKIDGKIWCMKSNTFRRLALKAVLKKRKRYEDLIAQTAVLHELSWYEKMLLADALIPMEFEAGSVIFKQGSCADGMYFVEDGSVICTIENLNTMEEFEVAIVSGGGYFGELALVTESTRAAKVTAMTDVKLAFLDEFCFEKLLGPCMEIFKENIDLYRVERDRIMNTTT